MPAELLADAPLVGVQLGEDAGSHALGRDERKEQT
jgi:hypothetical protein